MNFLRKRNEEEKTSAFLIQQQQVAKPFPLGTYFLAFYVNSINFNNILIVVLKTTLFIESFIFSQSYFFE